MAPNHSRATKASTSELAVQHAQIVARYDKIINICTRYLASDPQRRDRLLEAKKHSPSTTKKPPVFFKDETPSIIKGYDEILERETSSFTFEDYIERSCVAWSAMLLFHENVVAPLMQSNREYDRLYAAEFMRVQRIYLTENKSSNSSAFSTFSPPATSSAPAAAPVAAPGANVHRNLILPSDAEELLLQQNFARLLNAKFYLSDNSDDMEGEWVVESQTIKSTGRGSYDVEYSIKFSDCSDTIPFPAKEAAVDVAVFFAVFFEHFTKFKGRPFHFAGESYGGRYLPLFATALYDQNARLVEAGMTPVNLKSLLIGNGATDYFKLFSSYYDFSCTESQFPIIDVATCIRMKQALPRCERWTKASCIDTYDGINCAAAVKFCIKELDEPFETNAGGRNPYDITKKCTFELGNCAPFDLVSYLDEYLNDPKTRRTLGVDPSFTANFTWASYQVADDFERTHDRYKQTHFHVAPLLERGIRVLIYAGKNDWRCNWIGNEEWTLALDWSGKEEFGKQELREWEIDGEVMGLTRSARGLTFATIQDAGHMVYRLPDLSDKDIWLMRKKAGPIRQA